MVIDVHETWQNPVNLDVSVVQGLAEFRSDFLWIKGWWTIADHESLLYVNAWLYHSEDCKVPFTCGCLLTDWEGCLQLTFPPYFRCNASCIPKNLVKSFLDSILVAGGSIFKCGVVRCEILSLASCSKVASILYWNEESDFFFPLNAVVW